MTKNILYTNEMFPVRLVFFIDILLTGISFILSYTLCSFILPDIWSHGMLIQLPIIVALTSLIFLFIGIYKGYVKYDKVREVYSIFNAICLTNILTIILVVVNGKLFMEQDLMVPLSIIVVHSILSFVALAASRYLFKWITASKVKALHNHEHFAFVYNDDLSDSKLLSTLKILKKTQIEGKEMVPYNDFENFKEIFASKDKNSKIQGYYLFKGSAKQDAVCAKWLAEILRIGKPIYFVELQNDNATLTQNDLIITKVPDLVEEREEFKNKSHERMKAVLEAAISKENKNISDYQAF